MCYGCLIPEKEHQSLLSLVEIKAKAYAVAHHKMVVIFDTIAGIPQFCDLDTAITTGTRYYEYIGYVQPDVDGQVSGLLD